MINLLRKYMTTLFKVKEKMKKTQKKFYATPGGMSRPSAHAILSQHVIATLPDSLARRDNLLRALLVFSPKTGFPACRLREMGRHLRAHQRLASLRAVQPSTPGQP